MLVVSYFCTYVSHLLNFDLNDVVKFDIKYFFLEERKKKKKKYKPTAGICNIILRKKTNLRPKTPPGTLNN